MKKKIKILFVCTGNTCRSPMAETLFNQCAKINNVQAVASSAGLYANIGDSTTKNSNLALKKLGYKTTRHKSRPLGQLNLSEYKLIVTLTNAHKQQLNDLNNVISFYDLLGFDVLDPYGQSEQIYFDCAKQILAGVIKLIEILKSRDNKEKK